MQDEMQTDLPPDEPSLLLRLPEDLLLSIATHEDMEGEWTYLALVCKAFWRFEQQQRFKRPWYDRYFRRVYKSTVCRSLSRFNWALSEKLHWEAPCRDSPVVRWNWIGHMYPSLSRPQLSQMFDWYPTADETGNNRSSIGGVPQVKMQKLHALTITGQQELVVSFALSDPSISRWHSPPPPPPAQMRCGKVGRDLYTECQRLKVQRHTSIHSNMKCECGHFLPEGHVRRVYLEQMEGQCTSLWGLLPTASASLCINTFKLVCEFLRQARKAMHKFSAREIDFSIRFSSNIWSLLDSWYTSFLDHRTFHDVGCGVCTLFASCVSEAILQHDSDAVHNFLVDLRDFFVECLPTKPLEGRAFLEPVDGYRIQEWTRASGILTRRTMDYILITSILANVRCLQTGSLLEFAVAAARALGFTHYHQIFSIIVEDSEVDQSEIPCVSWPVDVLGESKRIDWHYLPSGKKWSQVTNLEQMNFGIFRPSCVGTYEVLRREMGPLGFFAIPAPKMDPTTPLTGVLAEIGVDALLDPFRGAFLQDTYPHLQHHVFFRERRSCEASFAVCALTWTNSVFKRFPLRKKESLPSDFSSKENQSRQKQIIPLVSVLMRDVLIDAALDGSFSDNLYDLFNPCLAAYPLAVYHAVVEARESVAALDHAEASIELESALQSFFLHELLLHLLLARHTAEAEHILAPHSDDGFGYDVWLRSLSSRKAIEMAIAAYGTRNLALLFRRSSTTPPGIHCCLTALHMRNMDVLAVLLDADLLSHTDDSMGDIALCRDQVLRAVLDTQDPDVIFAALLHGCFPWHSELRSVAEALAADASPEQKSLPRATTAPPQAFCDFLKIAQVAFLHRDPSDYEPPHPKGEDDDNAHTSIWLPLSE